jgi:hypothetical protein
MCISRKYPSQKCYIFGKQLVTLNHILKYGKFIMVLIAFISFFLHMIMIVIYCYVYYYYYYYYLLVSRVSRVTGIP